MGEKVVWSGDEIAKKKINDKTFSVVAGKLFGKSEIIIYTLDKRGAVVASQKFRLNKTQIKKLKRLI